MYISKMVTECDFTSQRYLEPVVGCAAIAKSAAGRWCEVMHGGPEFMADNNITTITPEQARKQIEDADDGWVDF